MANNMQLTFLNDIKPRKTACCIQVKIIHTWTFHERRWRIYGTNPIGQRLGCCLWRNFAENLHTASQ
ncbi:hypothetical protein YC2023_102797 [Brassica napus]